MATTFRATCSRCGPDVDHYVSNRSCVACAKSRAKAVIGRTSVYLPHEMLIEVEREAVRQNRSMAWMLQRAWKTARGEIRKIQ